MSGWFRQLCGAKHLNADYYFAWVSCSKMGHWCCVKGCSSNSKVPEFKRGIRFFSFPTWKRGYGQQMDELTKRRRIAWVAAASRKDITFNKISSSARVCSRHFHKGQPAYEMMEADPDWAPSLHLDHTNTRPTDSARSARRRKQAQLRKTNTPQAAETGDAGEQDRAEGTQEAAEGGQIQPDEVKQEAAEGGQIQMDAVKQEASEGGQIQMDAVKQEAAEGGQIQMDAVKQEAAEGGQIQMDEVKQEAAEGGQIQMDEVKQEAAEGGQIQMDEVKQEAAEDSWPLNSGDGTIQELGQTECNMCVLRHGEINRLLEQNRDLRRELDKLRITEDFFGDDGSKVRYYTGLPNLATFMALFRFLLPRMSVHKTSLTPFQMLLMTFMRFRLDLPAQHLAHLFQVSSKTLDRTFNDMVSFLYANLRHAIVWPDKETLHDEKVTRNVCQKYRILTGTIPVNMILPCEGEEVTTWDKIVTVCCALTNHCQTVVQ